MFTATDLHILIANERLDDLRRDAARRRRVRLARGAAPARPAKTAGAKPTLDVHARFGPTPTPDSRPGAVVSIDDSRSAADRAA